MAGTGGRETSLTISPGFINVQLFHYRVAEEYRLRDNFAPVNEPPEPIIVSIKTTAVKD